MLYWLDIETTGLDPRIDSMLEIGMVITDDDLNIVAPHMADIRIAASPAALANMVPFVKNMHEGSGLLADLQDGSAVSLRDAERAVINFVESTGDTSPRVMAGASVHFDRSFLRLMMPKLDAMFIHRHADVSAMREFHRRWAPEVVTTRPAGAHRPLMDLLDSINLARALRTNLKEKAAL